MSEYTENKERRIPLLDRRRWRAYQDGVEHSQFVKEYSNGEIERINEQDLYHE